MESTCSVVLLIVLLLPLASATGCRHATQSSVIVKGTVIPPGLAHRFSNLNGSAVTRYTSYFKDKSIAAHISEFCEEAAMVCDGNVDLILRASPEAEAAYFSWAQYTLPTDSTTPLKHSRKKKRPIGFFREKQLRQGGKMALQDLRNPVLRRAFLPLSLASELPFSSAELPALLKMLNISQSSLMARRMASTLKDCETRISNNEVRICATSAERLLRFAAEELGDNFSILETTSWEGSHETVELMDVHLKASEKDNVIACHDYAFPYTVFLCHKIRKTKVYEASWVASNGKTARGVAVCHMDTSNFNPAHRSFSELGTKPGEAECCHWMSALDPLMFSMSD